MGCGMSSSDDVHYSARTQYPNRPVASVTPQVQQYPQPVHQPAQQPQHEPLKQHHQQNQPVQHFQQQPAQHVQPVQQQQQPNTQPNVPPLNTSGSPITKEDIEKYISLDKKIREAETKNPIKKLANLKKTLADLEITEKQLMDHYNKCVAETAKEKADVDNLKQPNVKSFFQDQTLYDNKMSKEQEEYLEALNKQEVAQKEYMGVREQREKITKEIEALQKVADELHQLYQEQDKMLGGFFNGNYGSTRENQLESEFDMLMDRKQRILIAKQKWQNGRLLIHHACSQLAFGLQRWAWLTRIDSRNMQVRYQVATEARNNFIAASQNISNCQRYLSTIAFPYLKPAEIDTLNKATQHIYVDMQSGDRYNHATECYTITHRRCAALLQWFDSVIDKTIKSDLHTASQQASERQKLLRAERLSLLQQKYTENSGETIDLSYQETQEEIADDGDDEDTDKTLMGLTEADKVSMAGDDTTGTEKADVKPDQLTTDEPTRQPTPLPLSELAPPPSEEEIFGNMESLKKQHEQQMLDFEKAQETNRTRMEQGLQEKLKARRSRRARQTGAEE